MAVFKTEALMPYGRIDKFSSFKEAKEFVERMKSETQVDFIIIREETIYCTATLDDLLED